MIKCPRCGAPVANGSNHCTNCGMSVAQKNRQTAVNNGDSLVGKAIAFLKKLNNTTDSFA